MNTISREDMLRMRRKSVGASDSAAVLGLSRRKTPLHVYLDKRGELPPEEMNEPCRWGLMLEDVVAQAYAERTGCAYAPCETFATREGYPSLHACLDRVAVPVGGRPYPLEIKTAREAGSEWGEEGTDMVPREYLIQVQHQLLICGSDMAELAVLIGGQELRVYRFLPSPLLHSAIAEAAELFMKRVRDADPPPADYRHPATLELMERINGSCGEVTLDQSGLSLASAYRRHKQAIKEHQDAADAAKAELLDRMGGAEVAHLPEGWRVTRRKVERKGYQVAPTSYFYFNVKEPK